MSEDLKIHNLGETLSEILLPLKGNEEFEWLKDLHPHKAYSANSEASTWGREVTNFCKAYDRQSADSASKLQQGTESLSQRTSSVK